jgi:hypothetical protein
VAIDFVLDYVNGLGLKIDGIDAIAGIAVAIIGPPKGKEATISRPHGFSKVAPCYRASLEVTAWEI